MKKMIKGILATLGVLILLLVLALALHPYWVGPFVQTAVAKVAPTYTGTPVTLATCDVNLYRGLVALGDFNLANPESCAEKTAASVGIFRVQVDVASLTSDVIVVKEVTLTDVFVSYVKAGGEKMNFDVIADNVGAATQPKKATESPGQPSEAPQEVVTSEVSEESSPAKKVIIEKLTVGNLTVVYYGFPIPVPGTLVLTDIGKDTQGLSWEGAGAEIIRQIKAKLGSAGNGIISLGSQGLDIGTAGVTNALEAVKTLDIESAKDILNDTGKNLKGVGKDLKSLGKGLGKDLKGLLK